MSEDAVVARTERRRSSLASRTKRAALRRETLAPP
jgi:hypothetical protein